MGLSIVASLVDAHDGAIEVESEIGRGATFVISFPLAGTDDLLPPAENADSP
ncbi:MAG: ATP-binding protein [Thermomicrobiales bacterium]